MYFRHSPEIWEDHPALVPGVLLAEGVTDRPSVDARVAEYQAIARQRLERASEGDWPEVQAWRRVFAQMGLKPTQYRCAAESLLRRRRPSPSRSAEFVTGTTGTAGCAMPRSPSSR